MGSVTGQQTLLADEHDVRSVGGATHNLAVVSDRLGLMRVELVVTVVGFLQDHDRGPDVRVGSKVMVIMEQHGRPDKGPRA